MPTPPVSSVQATFTKGLITEATGLNFPENAATSSSNCKYTLTGDVVRRMGINTELNGVTKSFTRANKAISSYVWTNAGGDGESVLEVVQIGNNLEFYKINSATVTAPISTQYIQAIDISQYVPSGQTFDPTQEATYASGNGYLFVYHPTTDPVYCSYGNGAVTSSSINIQIRDFDGINDNLTVNQRPSTLSPEHQYNLQNQGWTSGNSWSAYSNDTILASTGTFRWTIGSVAGVQIGQTIRLNGTEPAEPWYSYESGSITAYDGNVITVNVYSVTTNVTDETFNNWQIYPISTGYISTWLQAEGNYPSNADVWWYFKDSTDAFNPAVTQPNVTLATGNAPQGHYLLNAFAQDRASVSAISGLTAVTTSARPTNGTFYAGRVWYTGVNASQQAFGDAAFYTWSENIYFSTVIQTASDFGLCYQTNDPTSEQLFDELPSDGGVIRIPGTGAIYKLFPIQNGMLVFAANGVWFLTGSQGIGFAANDYTIVQISKVRSISSTSYVDVLGLPYFWNEEGIYQVTANQTGSLQVNSITLTTIRSFYNEIPISSKTYVRGQYDPVNLVIQWIYKSTEETSVTDRYTFDSILNYNTAVQAFYPYSIPTTPSSINSISYVYYPYVQSNTPNPGFKYFCSTGTTATFAEEYDTTYVDWGSVNFTSEFTTGYHPGDANFQIRSGFGFKNQVQKKFQPQYVFLFSRTNGVISAYYFQGVWDYGNNTKSNRWTTRQEVYNTDLNYDFVHRRHKIRGHGYVLQFKVSSVNGQPFDIIGWAVSDIINQGV